jgi:hypothetical protein
MKTIIIALLFLTACKTPSEPSLCDTPFKGTFITTSSYEGDTVYEFIQGSNLFFFRTQKDFIEEFKADEEYTLCLEGNNILFTF